MELDDKFLHEHRRDPAPGFTRRLRERLRGIEDPAPRPLWRPMVMAAGAIAVLVGLFAIPAVRVGAQAMLDMFRVRNFVAVSFDPERLEKLRSLKQNNAMLVFDRQEVIQEPGRPVPQPSPGAAGAVAGFMVESPTYLPNDLTLDSVFVSGEGRARLGASSARLREVLDALDLRDIQVPPGLDAQDVSVHTYPVVAQSYRSSGRHRLALLQSRNPEVSLPAGVDLPRLGEIGLRILGMEQGEARRMAQSIDWRSTLLVPVPTNASSFVQVTVRGNPGLLVTTQEREEGGKKRRGGSVLLWTEADRVFALQGTLDGEALVQVAESVR